jgi:uncharacterized membrane protein
MPTTSAPGTTAHPVLLATAAVGAAVDGGVFLAFSLLTMPGLDRLALGDPRGAVTAMQAVNEVAVGPLFMLVLFGTALVAVVLGVSGLRRRTAAGWLTALGAATFLLGVIALTIVVNVPLNDALAAVGPADDPARAWSDYSPAWTVANHVRAAAGIAAAVLFLAARSGRAGSAISAGAVESRPRQMT